MFCDNLSVVNSTTMPGCKLMKRRNILSYHRVCEAQATSSIFNFFVHMNGKDNPADICTKFCSSHEWWYGELMKPLIFWHAREASPVDEGSVKWSPVAAATVPHATTLPSTVGTD